MEYAVRIVLSCPRMKDERDILFTRRFQNIYECLGVFSWMYVVCGFEGIDRTRFIEETNFRGTGTEMLLSILTNNGIIIDNNGELHLNERLFFDMSMWNLLVICEPWLKNNISGRKVSRLEKIMSSENLSRTYTQIYP